MIVVVCENCGTQLKIPDAYGGLSGQCNHCGARIQVPQESSSNEVIPPNQGERVPSTEAPSPDAGRPRTNRNNLKLPVAVLAGCAITMCLVVLVWLMFGARNDMAHSSPRSTTADASQDVVDEQNDFINEPEDASLEEAQAEEIGKWEGFRGIKWGTLRNEIDGLTAVSSPLIFTRSEDSLNVGNAYLESIWYCFNENRLAMVLLRGNGSENFLEIVKILSKRYGPPMHSDTSSVKAFVWWLEFSDSGEFDNGTKVVARMDYTDMSFYLIFEHQPLSDGVHDALANGVHALEKANQSRLQSAGESDL